MHEAVYLCKQLLQVSTSLATTLIIMSSTIPKLAQRMPFLPLFECRTVFALHNDYLTDANIRLLL